MVAAMRGLPLQAMSGHNEYGEDDGCEEMVFPLVGRMHTMSAHKADGYRDASDKFSRMGHSILLCTPTRCSVCSSRVRKAPISGHSRGQTR